MSFQWFTSVNYLPATYTVVAGEDVVADGSLPKETTLVVKAVDSVSGAAVTDFCVTAGEALPDPVCGDADGAATLSVPAIALQFDVEASDAGYYQSKRRVSATPVADQVTVVTVPLVQGGKVAVDVHARETGSAVEEACFQLKAIGSPTTFGNGCTGENGLATAFQAVTPGTYEVFIQAPGTYGHQWVGKKGGTGDQKAAARVVVEPGKTTQAPKVLLDRAGTITGVVTGADGNPMPRLNVAYKAIENFGSGESNGVFTDESGRYSIGHLGPYAWPLLFSPDVATGYPDQWSGNTGNRFQAVRTPVTAGGSSTYDITLTKTSTLRGKVLPGDSWFRLLAFNAATGDLVGYYQGEKASYEIALAGGQQVKLQWDYYGADTTPAWYADGKKIGIPVSGVKKLNLTH